MSRAAVAVLVVALLLSGCFGKGKDKGSDVDDGSLECPAGQILVSKGQANLTDGPLPTCQEVPVPRNDTKAAIPFFPNDGASERTQVEVASFDGHMIPATVYRPLIANATTQVPILLHSHGFGGTRTDADDAFQAHIAAGFGVVSYDQRGHGDAQDDSVITFMHPEFELVDLTLLVDEIAAWDWVLLDAPGDPRMGGIGYSYAGGMQLMGEIYDGRFDALVPEITWSDILHSLNPNDAIKSGWVNLYYLAGNARQDSRFSEEFHAGFAWAAATNEFPAGQAPGVPDIATELLKASPSEYPGLLDVPTLLVQGMSDTLFPLNEAVANLRQLEAVGAPTALYTHLAGHLLHTDSLAEGTSPYPVGLQGAPGPRPCGEMVDLQIAWHQRHLLGLNVSTGPRVCLVLEDETTVVGDTFPLNGTVMQAIDLGGPTPVAQAAAGPSIEIPLFTAGAETVIAGIPVLHGTYTSPGADAIVYFSIKKVGVTGFEAVVDDQVTPIRWSGPNAAALPFELDLGGIATRMATGEQLVLVVATTDPQYFGNAERIPGGVVLDDLVLDLPIVPADTPGIVLPT